MALDLGCGRGHISKFLTKVGTDSVQVILTKVINPLLPNISMHILHTVLYTFPKMLNLFDNQGLLQLVIISLMCDLGVILLGEIRCTPRGQGVNPFTSII